MKIFVRLAVLCGVAAALWMPPAAQAAGKAHRADAARNPAASGNVLDVRQFGARGDGSVFDTLAIQKALDTAGAAGGGTVRVSAGTYLIQPLHLRAHITLQLDEGATLRASDNPRDFEASGGVGGEHLLNVINAKHLTDVAITGRGVIDGSGRRWWQNAHAARDFGGHTDNNRPRLMNFAGCQGVNIEGVTLLNAPIFS